MKKLFSVEREPEDGLHNPLFQTPIDIISILSDQKLMYGARTVHK